MTKQKRRKRLVLTRRQRDALVWIRQFWIDHENEMGPTHQELADAMGIGVGPAAAHVYRLVELGALVDLGPPGAHRRWAPADPPEEAPRDA